MLVQLGLEGGQLLAPFFHARLCLLDRLANRLGFLLHRRELSPQVGDLGLELLALCRVGLDRLRALDEILLCLRSFRLRLDEARLVVSDLVLQIGDLRLLALELEPANLFDLGLQGADLVFVDGGFAAERLELAFEATDRLLELSDALVVAGGRLAL